MQQNSNYTDDNIRTLEGVMHIRMRPGMYIGRLGDGRNPNDGIYVLLKEIIDNSIDEFAMGFGKQIQIDIEDNHVRVRDFGRGIPLGSVVKAVSILNTGGKFDDKAFKKSVGLNGVGTKAVNALSEDGVLVNIDGNANRVSAYAWGPEKLVLVVGMNKVAKDTDAAMKRARGEAATINAQRFGLSTPCAKTGKCFDCKSPDTICCQFQITRFSRQKDRIHVILVDESLGF